MEVITRQEWGEIFLEMSQLMISNKALFTDIDAKFGDGDHGITIEKIAYVLKEQSIQWVNSDLPLRVLCESIGHEVTNVNGGSAGPLYGTYFEGLGMCLDQEHEIDAIMLKKMFQSALTELQFISNAKVGDKTMMDTLIPATEALLKAPDDILSIVCAAKDAAIAGAEKSKEFVSRFGRARMYKEKTIGTPDAGAQSCTCIFIGFYQALNDKEKRRK